MLNSEEWRFAIEDVRTRHAALLNMMHSTDQQAMSLLSLYVTLGSASASGFVASLGNQRVVPAVLTYPLLAATILFAVGALFCFRAMKTVRVGLPGRKADFWLWASREDVQIADVFRTYLEHLADMLEVNARASNDGALALQSAKRWGISAPLGGALVALVLNASKVI